MNYMQLLKNFSIPKNIGEPQLNMIYRAVYEDAGMINRKKKEKKNRKDIPKSFIVPEQQTTEFMNVVDYFSQYGLQTELKKSGVSVKIQLEKSVRNVISYRLPRKVNGRIIGSVYLNMIKSDRDAESLGLNGRLKRDNATGVYKISRVELIEMLAIMNRKVIDKLIVISKRVDNEFKYNIKKGEYGIK